MAEPLSRRGFLGLSASAVAAWPRREVWAMNATNQSPIRRRKIPRSGEEVPVIGLGTWQTFDVGDSAAERAPLAEVLAAFLNAGGRLIDSSPMYGRAEAVVGDLLAGLGERAAGVRAPFLATKVWTTGKARGEEQMRTSMGRMRRTPMDLMQIHNLQDWRTHLATLRDWKAAGTIRYIGVTHYDLGAFDELERIIKKEEIDFVQVPYSIGVRKAEERLLPAAADHKTAVIVMRPFEAGSLFADVRGKPLPPFAAEIGVGSWAQFFLKFILGHPAVTCPIPATSKPQHLIDNLQAGVGPLPDDVLRRKMIAAVGA